MKKGRELCIIKPSSEEVVDIYKMSKHAPYPGVGELIFSESGSLYKVLQIVHISKGIDVEEKAFIICKKVKNKKLKNILKDDIRLTAKAGLC